jgi:hypothetical protein
MIVYQVKTILQYGVDVWLNNPIPRLKPAAQAA